MYTYSNTQRANKMKNPISVSNLFATPENIEAMQDYVLKMNGAERIAAMTVMGMTWNLASKLVDEAMAKDEATS